MNGIEKEKEVSLHSGSVDNLLSAYKQNHGADYEINCSFDASMLGRMRDRAKIYWIHSKGKTVMLGAGYGKRQPPFKHIKKEMMKKLMEFRKK